MVANGSCVRCIVLSWCDVERGRFCVFFGFRGEVNWRAFGDWFCLVAQLLDPDRGFKVLERGG